MEYYVDNSLSSSGNGTSWATAWNSLNAINWSSVHPGDNVVISGGTSGQTYNETLNVKASGSTTGQVTIEAATDPGHNGPVTINGGETRANGVSVSGQNYVTVKGLNVRNITDAGMAVKNSTGVTLDGNSVYSGDPGGGNARGYDIRNSTDSLIQNNSFSTPTSTSAQTDGIWSSGNQNVTFQYNHIVDSNSNTNGHSDDFQSYQDKNVTVRNNFFQQANSATVNNHGAWMSDAQSAGAIKFYNNLVLAPNLTADSAVTYWNESTANQNASADFWNNTIIGGHRGVNIDGSSGTQVMNNIVEPASGGYGVFIANANPAGGNVDHNLIWAPNASTANVNGKTVDWSGWQSLGYDHNGVSANPNFVDPSSGNYSLASGSPAIGHGATIPGVSTDYNNTPRPQGAYDIGAFQPSAGTAAAGTPATATPPAATPPAATPAAGTPATGTPAAPTPATGTPAAHPTTGATPATGTPAADPTTGSSPATGTLAADPTTGTTPATGTPAADPTTGSSPATGTLAADPTTGSSPATGTLAADPTAGGSPATGTPASGQPSAPSDVVTPSTLTAALSKDRSHHHAWFAAKSDGNPSNAATSVTAQGGLDQQHGSSFSGNWTSGRYDLGKDFASNKVANSTPDRNLYAGQVTHHGAGYVNQAIPMPNNSAIPIKVGAS